MLLTQTNRLKLNQQEAAVAKQLCRLSKNMFNVGLYNVRQYFFQERKHLRYEGNYHHSKTNENYDLLATDIAQQTLKIVDRSFNSFFKLLQMKQRGELSARVNIPAYLPKEGYFLLVIPIRPRDLEKMPSKNWLFTVPTSRKFRREHGTFSFQVPERLRGLNIKEIRILPKFDGHYFDAAYVYEGQEEKQIERSMEMLGIDLGLNNFASCVSTTKESFVIDGRKIKSINQWYNKENARLQSIKDLQKIQGLTHRQASLLDRRNHQVQDFLNKSARQVVNWCIKRSISKIVVGYNPDLKQSVNLGKRNNQNFTQIPVFTFKRKLQSLCERYGIEVVEQEESYTSKASALDGDTLPVWNADNPKKYEFSGKRIKRGLYRTAKDWIVNADCNGALNILRKHTSKLDEFLGQFRGCLAQPLRIKIR
ncbi:transposase [Laspinema sp. A4]|uniref:RNA-guided endonuclease InsQ/TnpB family protein n=1 Tax=Laspinema sp. D2d TaxID=2953686 RepID=UPI0021BB00BB|nr:transposase [Laspinema sp. D2d]MCT7986756.1 transposase [Laspinema sp. D2d]